MPPIANLQIIAQQVIPTETDNSERRNNNFKTNCIMNPVIQESIPTLFVNINSTLPHKIDSESLKRMIMSPIPRGKIMFTNISISTEVNNEKRINCYVNGNEFSLLDGKLKSLFNFNNCCSVYINNFSEKIGKITSNLLYNDFNFFSSPKEKRQFYGNIRYTINPFGLRGPRKFKVSLPRLIDDEHIIYASSLKNNSKFIDQYINEDPIWFPEYKEYRLNFNERVKKSSKKNFIMYDSDMEDHDKIIQFGMIDENTFALDFQHPISIFQAFCIGVTSIIEKFFCE